MPKLEMSFVSLQWAFPKLLSRGPLLRSFEVYEHAELLYFSGGRFSPVREPGEGLPIELSASGSHPYASLFLRCFLFTRKYIRHGRYVGKGNRLEEVKERDLAFGVQYL